MLIPREVSLGRLLLLLVFAVSVVACGGSSEPVVDTQGTVQYGNLETGWWYIEADSGVVYTPFPLPDEFKVPGLRVQASLLLLKDTASFFPGTYVRIVSIEKSSSPAATDRPRRTHQSPQRRHPPSPRTPSPRRSCARAAPRRAQARVAFGPGRPSRRGRPSERSLRSGRRERASLWSGAARRSPAGSTLAARTAERRGAPRRRRQTS